MQYAAAQFAVNRGHRTFARKVIVIVAASYAYVVKHTLLK